MNSEEKKPAAEEIDESTETVSDDALEDVAGGILGVKDAEVKESRIGLNYNPRNNKFI